MAQITYESLSDKKKSFYSKMLESLEYAKGQDDCYGAPSTFLFIYRHLQNVSPPRTIDENYYKETEYRMLLRLPELAAYKPIGYGNRDSDYFYDWFEFLPAKEALDLRISIIKEIISKLNTTNLN